VIDFLRRLVAWFRPRPWEHPSTYVSRGGECVCGRLVEGDDWHLLVAGGGDDGTLGMGDGGSFMSADFCPAHCPGGCRQGCPTVTV
jgi:hypothetical protein